ncbi:sensor histidine kinase [Neisseria canis]|uniref:histidine kinase n=1 Tax=Neisseria canis TaxID=493 RepID=A0A1X3CWK7_9NEIS|nr:HAMP domain-containing sensor histidine kinase [Neisseria canis]OSI11892.1 two-component sensor histidine kinase [Neisseria canis]VEE99158.1 two-component system sensor kinase [Neisseria canis]
MKLFQRIFATFCAVIICAIFVASFSFWVVQNTIAENHFKQQRVLETTLLNSMISAFRARGAQGAKDTLQEWSEHPISKNVYMITGDNRKDVLGRPIDPKVVESMRNAAVKQVDLENARIEYDRWGEEYLFFVRDWKNRQLQRPISPLFIPGLPLEPVWHEIIILSFIFVVGLLLAYILANNITKPIRILGRGMNRLAAGDLETRISQQMTDRDDELSQLADQFDKMAQQLQKLVEKERHLLHHVSHEMRSPLARMQAIVGLIQTQPKKQDEYLQRLESELVRMDALVGELLTLSRLETDNIPMEKENLALVPFLRHLVEDSQAVAEKNHQTVELVVEKVPEDAKLLANESYLYRAFDNVIRNAMNYSPEGSTIKVKIYQDSKNWMVDITDNGPGVSENQLPHIFTAFYRADSSANKQGTGLGLALTKHIVEQHCGKIMANNISPNGLRIRFVLPKRAKELKAGL